MGMRRGVLSCLALLLSFQVQGRAQAQVVQDNPAVQERALAEALGRFEVAREQLAAAEASLAAVAERRQQEDSEAAARDGARLQPMLDRITLLNDEMAVLTARVAEVPDLGRLRDEIALLDERRALSLELIEVAGGEQRKAEDVLKAQQTGLQSAQAELDRASAEVRDVTEEVAQLDRGEGALARRIETLARETAPRAGVAEIATWGLARRIAASTAVDAVVREDGIFSFRNVPGGRLLLLALNEGAGELAWQELPLERDRTILLKRRDFRPFEQGAPELAASGFEGGPPRPTGAYDQCALEHLRGITSDVAAAAVITACQASFPDSARFQVSGVAEEPPTGASRFYLLFESPARALAASLEDFNRVLAERAATERSRLAAEARAELRQRIATLTAPRERAADAVQAARGAVERAQAALALATAQYEDVKAASRDELAELGERIAALTAKEAAIVTAAEQVARHREELSRLQPVVAAERARIAAEQRQRTERFDAEAAALAPPAARAKEAQQWAAAAVTVTKAAYASALKADYVRRHIRVQSNLKVEYSLEFCYAIANTGPLALRSLRFEVVFKGRNLADEMTDYRSLFWRPLIDFVHTKNRNDEFVYGLGPNQSWRVGEPVCPTIHRDRVRQDDFGRIFDRLGGFSTEIGDWQIVPGQVELARPDRLRERPRSFTGKSWEFVEIPPEELFRPQIDAVKPLRTGAALTVERVLPSLEIVQQRLKQLGLYPGAVDGIMGPGTRRAIRSFEASRGLPETGEITPALAEALGP